MQRRWLGFLAAVLVLGTPVGAMAAGGGSLPAGLTVSHECPLLKAALRVAPDLAYYPRVRDAWKDCTGKLRAAVKYQPICPHIISALKADPNLRKYPGVDQRVATCLAGTGNKGKASGDGGRTSTGSTTGSLPAGLDATHECPFLRAALRIAPRLSYYPGIRNAWADCTGKPLAAASNQPICSNLIAASKGDPNLNKYPGVTSQLTQCTSTGTSSTGTATSTTPGQ